MRLSRDKIKVSGVLRRKGRAYKKNVILSKAKNLFKQEDS